MPGRLLEDLYGVIGWVEDPYSDAGRRRFEKALECLKKFVEHSWVKELVESKREVRVLEVCSGTGIGGVALAKTLIDRGVEVHLLITDLRSSALRVASEWGSSVLGVDVDTRVIDARKVHLMGEVFDIVLMFGYSAPHFNPWETVRLLASVSSVLGDKGVFVAEESDRRYNIFLVQGYKHVLPEPSKGEVPIISVHGGYDIVKGTVRRSYIDLTGGKKPVTVETFLWGLAELAAFTWIFFEDVDLTPLDRGTASLIVAREPRRRILPGDLKEPSILKESEQCKH